MTKSDSTIDDKTSGLNWSVYIILCSDNSYYTGISTDPFRRFSQHTEGSGARYFRKCLPLEIVYLEHGHTRSSATRRESQIKNMSKNEKSALLTSDANRIGIP